MPDDDGRRSHGMSAEEIALFHKWKNEEAPKRLMRGTAE